MILDLVKRKAFILPFLLLGSLFLFLYKRYEISENILIKFTGQKFYYTMAYKAFNPLILVLVGFVCLFLILSVMRNNKLEEERKFKANFQFSLSVVFASLLGYGFHIYQAYLVITEGTSIFDFEDSIFKYYISDISIVIGFAIGGLLYLRPIINYGKEDI